MNEKAKPRTAPCLRREDHPFATDLGASAAGGNHWWPTGVPDLIGPGYVLSNCNNCVNQDSDTRTASESRYTRATAR
eukprot:10077517-Lingulodinium_polyedra.AAC.1